MLTGPKYSSARLISLQISGLHEMPLRDILLKIITNGAANKSYSIDPDLGLEE